jgi:hypothetical protein
MVRNLTMGSSIVNEIRRKVASAHVHPDDIEHLKVILLGSVLCFIFVIIFVALDRYDSRRQGVWIKHHPYNNGFPSPVWCCDGPYINADYKGDAKGDNVKGDHGSDDDREGDDHDVPYERCS